jgi:hypothetical protein
VVTAAGCPCCCHGGGAYPPPCDQPGGCGPHTDRTCALTTCTNQPAPPLQLCRGHAAKIGQWLADLDRLYTTLDPGLTLAQDHDGGRGGTLASQRAPGRLAIMTLTDRRTTTGGPTYPGPVCPNCRHDTCTDMRPALEALESHTTRALSVLEVLHAFAEEVREARELAAPSTSVIDCVDRMPGTRPHGPAYGLPCWHPTCRGVTGRRVIPLPPTVASERRLLATHLDWLLAQGDTAARFYGEIADVHSQLLTAHGHRRPRPAARCWVPVPGGTCDGPVWAGRGSAHCSRCGTSWAGAEFLRISLALDEGAA